MTFGFLTLDGLFVIMQNLRTTPNFSPLLHIRSPFTQKHRRCETTSRRIIGVISYFTRSFLNLLFEIETTGKQPRSKVQDTVLSYNLVFLRIFSGLGPESFQLSPQPSLSPKAKSEPSNSTMKKDSIRTE